jgi:hypothetical protein
MGYLKEYTGFSCANTAELAPNFVHIVRGLGNNCGNNTAADIFRRFIFLVPHNVVKIHVLQSGLDMGK